MIPEISKLNWSTVKPTFEEVKGKTMFLEWDGFKITNQFKALKLEKKEDYDTWFGSTFTRYAVIDTTEPDPEPLPLWGVKPELKQSNLIRYGEWYAIHEQTKEEDNTNAIVTFSYLTRAEAIEAWNKVAEKLNEISL